MTEGPALPQGVVMRLDARGCLVRMDAPVVGGEGGGRLLWCSVRGRIHLKDRTGQKTPVAVGDRVEVVTGSAGRGTVEGIFPRRSMLSRPDIRRTRVEHVLAANVDQVVIVSAAADPDFNPALVDRMLAVVEWSRLAAVLVVNKIDLVDAEPAEAATYRGLGYPVLATSATNGTGIDALREHLRRRTSVVAGHSGVGKSSLLNALQPGLGLAVAEVNEVSGRGVHTTTAAVWVDLDGGGAVIDTAGVREFGLFGIPARELSWLFKDLAAAASGCRFPDCSHTHEPDCAVIAAAASGRVAPFRYDSYLKILESMSPGT